VSSIRFEVAPRSDLSDVLEIVPVDDGELLTDRIHRFENEAGMEKRPTSYGGLIPDHGRFGSLASHFLGATELTSDRAPVLGCDCGELGCWPLLCHIEANDVVVVWRDFGQPFRPSRDYSDFGPYTFDREAYAAALAELEQVVGSDL
jgi:hypothetical protein